LNEFAQAAKRQTAAPSYAKVKQMCTIFQNDLVVAARESTEDQLRELRATVQSNIQIVNYGKRRYDVTKERQQLLETLTTQTLSLLR
jgi:16S rRNA G1207 methylase RsmC